jgi:hypothetical protein
VIDCLAGVGVGTEREAEWLTSTSRTVTKILPGHNDEVGVGFVDDVRHVGRIAALVTRARVGVRDWAFGAVDRRGRRKGG